MKNFMLAGLFEKTRSRRWRQVSRKHSALVIFVIACLLPLVSCGDGLLSPKQAFTAIEEEMGRAADALESVRDGKSAHQANQMIEEVSKKLDDTLQKTRPIKTLTSDEIRFIRMKQEQSMVSMTRIEQAVGRIRGHPDISLVMEDHIYQLGASMKKTAIVMMSYGIE